MTVTTEPTSLSALLNELGLKQASVDKQLPVLRAWLAPVALTAERTAAVDALITDWRGQGPVNLPGGVSVLRVSGRLTVTGEDRRGDQ